MLSSYWWISIQFLYLEHECNIFKITPLKLNKTTVSIIPLYTVFEWHFMNAIGVGIEQNMCNAFLIYLMIRANFSIVLHAEETVDFLHCTLILGSKKSWNTSCTVNRNTSASPHEQDSFISFFVSMNVQHYACQYLQQIALYRRVYSHVYRPKYFKSPSNLFLNPLMLCFLSKL